MSNSIQAYWLGHSTFKIITPQDQIIYIDPFLNENPKTPEDQKNPEKADFILLTHGHEDHVGDTLPLAKKTDAKVVGMVELIRVLKKHGLDDSQAMEINKGGTAYFNNFKVTMTSANHSSSFNGEYTGEPAGLILRFKNGYTIYNAGDTNVMYDMKIYGELYKPDMVFLPIGDHYTMAPEEAAYAAGLIGAKYAVPIHYGTWPILKGSPDEFRKLVEEKYDTKVIIPEIGKNFMP